MKVLLHSIESKKHYHAIYYQFDIRNIIVKNTGGYASFLGGKSESHNKTLATITRALLLNSSHKKELWCFAYQYAIWLSRLTENRLYGDFPYFLWHVIIPHTNISKYGV